MSTSHHHCHHHIIKPAWFLVPSHIFIACQSQVDFQYRGQQCVTCSPTLHFRNKPGVLRTQLSGAALAVYENRPKLPFPQSSALWTSIEQQDAAASLGSLSFLFPPLASLCFHLPAALFSEVSREPEVPGNLSPPTGGS